MSATADKTSQPTGLYVLFFAEAWERFSYYGMRALLVLYMVNHLKFAKNDALSVYGTYTGLVYLTPIIGGYLADKYLGRRKAVLIGAIVMALGHLAMAFEPLLYQALGLLIVGNGFFKPNISTIVGGLYHENDPRRDGGFTIFYMGINLGAFFSPIVCGTLGESVGWHYGFSAAAIGMVAGLGVFVWGQKFFGHIGLPPAKAAAVAKAEEEGKKPETKDLTLDTKDWTHVGIITAICCAIVWGTLFSWKWVGPVVGKIPWYVQALFGFGLLALLVVRTGGKKSGIEWQRVAVIAILCFFNIFFWMGFEQAGGTMTLFADTQTNRNMGGLGVAIVGLFMSFCGFMVYRTTRHETSGQALWVGLTGLFGVAGLAIAGYGGYLLSKGQQYEIPASQFQAINPLLIVAFAPAVSLLWTKADLGKWKTSSATKMAVGMTILGLGFIVMYFGQSIAKTTGTVGPQWLVAVYAIHTLGELCLSPIGLSMVTKLSPARMVSLMMGLWFLSSAIANKAAGELEGIVEQYHISVYGVLVGSSIGAAAVLLVLVPILKKWMHGAEDTH
ncbi:MAG: peptide MFS transporter [Polyangiaceae bacterium]|nr:peptide MFS transporter [Polyangiaceae bacterium]